ncbi:MAG: hypothetical protein ABI779_25905, partial [Acidobacteriota bacterium]
LVQLVGGASGAHRVQAALRGLAALCATDPALVGALVEEWERVPEARRDLLLLLAERLVVTVPRGAPHLHPLLERIAETARGTQKLQAAIALGASRRAGNDAPDADLGAAPERHAHQPLGAGFLESGREMYGAIPLTRGSSAVRQSTQQLAAVLDVDPRLLERAAAGVVAPGPTARRRTSADTLEGEMLLRPSTALDTFVVWAVDEATAGCFGAVDVSTLAQALLNMDDPWVLTRPAVGLPELTTWPVDDELAQLLAAGGGSVVDALSEPLRIGLTDDERVLGAVLHSFSRDTDVVLHLETRWVRDVANLAELRRPTTFNGRSFTYYDTEAFEPEQPETGGWLTFRTGGQGLFFNTAVPLTPAARVWRSFGWLPRPDDPSRWEREGTVVARFEVWNGPVRGATQDRLYRQPILFRWVVTETAWREAERALGATFRTMSDLATHTIA